MSDRLAAVRAQALANEPVLAARDDVRGLLRELQRELVARGVSHDALTDAAAETGMDTLWSDGTAKVEAGLISLEELHRVVPH